MAVDCAPFGAEFVVHCHLPCGLPIPTYTHALHRCWSTPAPSLPLPLLRMHANPHARRLPPRRKPNQRYATLQALYERLPTCNRKLPLLNPERPLGAWVPKDAARS